MSRFRDDFAVAFEDVLFEQGETLVYTAINESPRTITAPIWRAVETIRDESNHETTETIAKCYPKKHATLGVLSPRVYDSIEWDGRVWDFHQVKGDQGDVWELWFRATEVQQYGKKPSQL